MMVMKIFIGVDEVKMYIGVYSSDKDKASSKMREVVEKTGEFIIEESERTVVTRNNVIRAMSPTDSSKGCRNHRVYIDKHTKEEDVLDVILPTLTPKVWQHGEKWKVKDCIHFF